MGFFVEKCGRYILLTQGQKALVDCSVYDKIAKLGWRAARYGKKFYACRDIAVGTKSNGRVKFGILSMSRLISNPPSGKIADHINHDTLDNRAANLRHATQHENTLNRGRLKSKTGFIGVGYDHRQAMDGLRPWQGSVVYNGKRTSAGVFYTPEEAARARDKIARELHGEFAVLNFPEDQQ